jgi:hypothetical protein
MKIFREDETSMIVWMIMAIIIIAVGADIVLSAEEIAKKNKTELPVWFVKIPGFIGLVVGILALSRCLVDIFIHRKPLLFRDG